MAAQKEAEERRGMEKRAAAAGESGRPFQPANFMQTILGSNKLSRPQWNGSAHTTRSRSPTSIIHARQLTVR